ncbi:MAG TPA: carboxypeptidase-like regulatory domain-containing protein, partial [Vicinamibacterales bacterium]
MRTRRFSLVMALLLAMLPVVAHAQTGAASMTGLVTDQTGAAVPGATVTATNQATNVPYTAVSNDAGNYTITSVPIGTYIVKAELSSFKTATTKPIAVEAKQILRLDFKLEVGGLEQSVEVTGESPVLQTESATVGEVISGTTVSSLPLNGRNTGQLSLLLPGVVTPNPSTFTAIRNVGSGGRPYVNGNREQTNNYTIDGVDMNESIDNLVAYQPSPDALAEISVETNNYAADSGNVAGAVISNVIKSGTNEYHGNVFDFYRNSRMDANSWQNNRSNAAKPDRRQSIYGGTFGGPILKNTLFFFGNFQG